jgi:hypothetical protein
VPKLLSALNINLGLDASKTRSVTLNIDSAVIRHLDFDKFNAFMNSRPENSALTRAWRTKNVVVATSDFVLLNYSLDIAPNDTFGVTLGAKIDSLLKLSNKLALNNDSLGITITRVSAGSFLVGSNKPLVLAVYVQKQKTVQVQGDEHGFKDWPIISEKDIVDPTKK